MLRTGQPSRPHLGAFGLNQGTRRYLYQLNTHTNCVKRTRQEAEGQGWVLLGSCTEKFLGHRFANPEDDSIILIFDDAGFIAGSQSVVPASVADASVMARNPAYQVEKAMPP